MIYAFESIGCRPYDSTYVLYAQCPVHGSYSNSFEFIFASQKWFQMIQRQ